MSASAIGWVAAVLVCIGSAAAVGLVVGTRENPAKRWWRRYENALDTDARALRMNVSGARIARIQAVLAVLIVVAAFALDNVLLLGVAFVDVIAPMLWLSQQKHERITKIEEQLESWLQLLASALRASGGMGAAIESTTSLVPVPLRDEIDLVIKKTQLGVPLDRALLEMGLRADSQSLSGALSTIIVGQRTGGDVPKLLESAADSLREMARLEGMVRAKTAQSKLQTVVMALAPFAFILGLERMRPGWFDGLFADPRGYYAVAIAILCWLAAIVLARKILEVED